MTPQNRVALAITLASAAVLGTQTLVYGLVYPAGSARTKAPIVLGLLLGSLLSSLAGAVSYRALRRARGEPERFAAVLGLALSGFFLLVVVVGFGVPTVFLSPKD